MDKREKCLEKCKSKNELNELLECIDYCLQKYPEKIGLW